MADIDKQTISKLHELLVKKTISPAELLQETIKKARDAEPKINAFREFTLDTALQYARLAENKFLAGDINSQVLGIPFSISAMFTVNSPFRLTNSFVPSNGSTSQKIFHFFLRL